MSTPLPAATSDAPGCSLTTLDLEGNRKASVKSAKPDLLSFRPKPGSPRASAVASPSPPATEECGIGEGVNKGAASRKASVATNLKAVEEVSEEQGKELTMDRAQEKVKGTKKGLVEEAKHRIARLSGRGERGDNIAIVVTGADEDEEEDEIVGDRD